MQTAEADRVVLDTLVGLRGQGGGSFSPAPRGEVRCLLGTPGQPALLRIAGGQVAAVSAEPGPLPDYQFAFQASAAAWLEFWQPLPRPGFHDLFALVKRGEATLAGNLQPLMAHLQFFKDLLASPRSRVGRPA